MNERDVKFFRPLWLRVLMTAIVAVWFAVETIFGHDGMWMTITGIGVVYCVWNFFLRFPKDVPAAAPPDAGQPPPSPPA
jgi:hypothetical protein